jgi:glucose-1-phosphate adenylyltransferase
MERRTAMPKKKCIAMILAGGQGTRLGALTKTIAKPAVPFGGKYRIIDFPLSNCSNSGIDTVGILTQYQPFFLHSYVGIGSPWDLDRKDGGVFVLPPYTHDAGGEWYKGTADAIFQNVAFIDQYDPVWVVILSGDHIYKMDYNKMLEYHEAREADATLAVIEVPWEDTRRFGIMNTDMEDRIVEFEEKPAKAKNNLASMGVYVFRWQYLRYYLEKDSRNSASDHDFGRNIIPMMLEKGQSVYAYRFKGYWRDVGTVESLWAANMDLLADRPQLDLHDPSWRIYSVNPVRPPHFAGRQSHVSESIVSEGCQIFGEVKRCVLFPNVVVERGAQVMDSVLMPGVTVAPNAVIRRAVVGPDAIVAENAQIGGDGPVTLFMEKARTARKGARA